MIVERVAATMAVGGGGGSEFGGAQHNDDLVLSALLLALTLYARVTALPPRAALARVDFPGSVGCSGSLTSSTKFASIEF
jgi:hypothetical protein